MSILKIVGVGIISASAAVLIRSMRPDLGVQVSLTAGAVLLIYAITELSGIAEKITAAANSYGLNADYIGLIIKALGIAYAAQLAADVCKDSGETAIASRVELCGKVMILAASVPAMLSVIDLISSLL